MNRRIDSETALNDKLFYQDNLIYESNNEEGAKILNSMTKFVMGKNLQRSVASFMMTRKVFNENNPEMIKLFKEIDYNNDGSIDIEELYLKYGKYFAGTDEEQWEKVEEFIKNVDINKSGKIEYAEFLTVASIINKEMHVKTMREIFNFYDESNNGYIDAGDLKEIFEDQNMSTEAIKKIINDFDKDGDRKISFDEFCDMFNEV